MYLEQCLTINRGYHHRVRIAWMLVDLADVWEMAGNHNRAHSLLDEACSIFRELGDIEGMDACRRYIG